MADKSSTVAAINAAAAEGQAIGVAPPPPPPPGDFSWFTSKAAGSITKIGTALLKDSNPGPGQWVGSSGFPGILSASGQVYAPLLGPAGSLHIDGGGHTDWYGRDVYKFDLATMLFSQIKAPWPSLFVVGGYHANTFTGALFANAAGTATLPDQPSSGHNFGQKLYLPPGVGHNDPKGAVLYTCIPSLTPGGQVHGKWAWIFTLSDNKFAIYSTNAMSVAPEYSHAFLDASRNRVIVHGYGQMCSLDLNTRTYYQIGPAIPSGVPYMVWDHVTSLDLYVGIEAPYMGGPTRVYILDPNGNSFTSPGINGAWPFPSGTSQSGGGFWSPADNAFIYHHGFGEKELRIVTEPTSGNPRTANWNVAVQSFVGDTPAKDTTIIAGAHCKRLVNVPAADGYLWLGNANEPIQFFKRA